MLDSSRSKADSAAGPATGVYTPASDDRGQRGDRQTGAPPTGTPPPRQRNRVVLVSHFGGAE